MAKAEFYTYKTIDSTTPYLAVDLTEISRKGGEVFQILPKEGAAVRRPREAGTGWLIVYRIPVEPGEEF